MLTSFRWAIVLLPAFELLLSADVVKCRLTNCDLDGSSHFSGMECAGTALQHIQNACIELCGFRIPYKDGYTAIKATTSTRLLQKQYPGQCLFSDVLD